MNKVPTFNIILPVYNAESSIQSCVDSVLAQSFSDWRLLIMDDGSTDKTWELLSSYGDDRVDLFSQENAGAYVARNNLIQHASCRCLLRCKDYECGPAT